MVKLLVELTHVAPQPVGYSPQSQMWWFGKSQVCVGDGDIHFCSDALSPPVATSYLLGRIVASFTHTRTSVLRITAGYGANPSSTICNPCASAAPRPRRSAGRLRYGWCGSHSGHYEGFKGRCFPSTLACRQRIVESLDPVRII